MKHPFFKCFVLTSVAREGQKNSEEGKMKKIKEFFIMMRDFLRNYFDLEEPNPYVSREKAAREKFAAHLGKCATIPFIEGNMVRLEEDGYPYLAIIDSEGIEYPIISMVASSVTLTHPRVRMRHIGKKIEIEFLD